MKSYRIKPQNNTEFHRMKPQNNTESHRMKPQNNTEFHRMKSQNNTEFHRMKPQNDTEFLYRDLTEKIIGCAFEVYKVLGYGFLEKVYKNSLISELRADGVQVEDEYPIKVKYKTDIVGDYYADLFVERKVIVEIKSEEKYNSAHEAQLLNYLKATGVRIGLLINFGKKKCEFKRLIF